MEPSPESIELSDPKRKPLELRSGTLSPLSYSVLFDLHYTANLPLKTSVYSFVWDRLESCSFFCEKMRLDLFFKKNECAIERRTFCFKKMGFACCFYSLSLIADLIYLFISWLIVKPKGVYLPCFTCYFWPLGFGVNYCL